MDGLRSVGLAAAVLAGAGGAALVTWSYISARRNKPEPKDTPETAHSEPPAESAHFSAPAAAQPPQEKHLPSKQVLVLGLDGSGKTSVLNSILTNRGGNHTTPTEGFNAMCINTGESRMELLEVGGSEPLRPYWERYLSRALAVIFVVDSADHSRLPLAKKHLHQLIQQDSSVPLLVLANKQDLHDAYHITEIHDALALSEVCEARKLFLIGTHVTKDDHEISSGLQDTVEFLAQLISEYSDIKT
ncbi:ADP-ribosylation factor-like protein 9 [Spea bombifrons]|uniref:ADP-ribosylation factor-like protein 9 n=1 Tax=Spea bombifrons TaxID=233779 RepID=UPI00234BFE32|nr:ADP-ribosylation factor-like protein 9 [Spea bombifrons]